jgi:DNA-binding CsgD family transcriptional regulator
VGVPIVGREAELQAIADFLAQVSSGPAALVLTGTAGIGKTTLWAAGVAAARERAARVLVTRASESEARMSYAGLGDLLAAVPDEMFDALPDPLRRAVDRALLRTEDVGGAPDARAVSLAVSHVLRVLAAETPVVIAIDDVQWLDHPSARVLSFVLRRLTDEPIRVLESQRIGSGAPGDPIETDRVLESTHLTVGPLSVGALGRILRQRASSMLSRPDVVRIHDVTHGNPLFALEIARAAAAHDPGGAIGERAPVPEDLQRVLSARLAGVPVAAHGALLAMAAMAQPTWERLQEIVGPNDRALAALGRAEAAGIIERVDGAVRFSHPLFASTVYANATDRDRRAVHLQIASRTSDPEEAARHLALGTGGRSAPVAAALDRAARHARARGAPDAAAELAELASGMTPTVDATAGRGRRLAAAEYHFDAGDAGRAQRVLREAIDTAPAGAERAAMLSRLAEMSWMNLVDGVQRPSEEALAEAGDDDELVAGIHVSLAWVAFYLGELDSAQRHAREAAGRVVSAPMIDPGIQGDVLATVEFMSFLGGRPDSAMSSEAIRLQDVAMQDASWTESSVYTTPRSIRALELMWSGRLDDAREILEHELETYDRNAMFTVRQEVLCYLAELECRAGRWSLARQYADDAMDTVVESGQTATQSHVVLFNQAWPAALLGEADTARELATAGVRGADANDDRFNAAWNHAVLGFLDLSFADYEDARVHLEQAAGWLERLASVEPGIIPCLPDLAEADVALGRFDEAERVIERLGAAAAAGDRPWAAGTATRGRALIAAAAGDLETAARLAEQSVRTLELASHPFELARSRLVLGQIHRRRKQKRLARESLEQARSAFAQLGARPWAERADAELRRIGGRTPTPFELTETESSIAALVARGLTNREAADALFVSPATVQANLKRIYQKLGVRSRTELAATLGRSAQG